MISTPLPEEGYDLITSHRQIAAIHLGKEAAGGDRALP